HAPCFEREPQTFFALALLLLDLFEFGDITPDSLKFDDLTARVQDRMVNPLLPADGAVGKQHLVLVYLHTRVLDSRFDVLTSDLARRLGDEVEEFRADELFLYLAEIPAVGVIDEGQRGVRQVAANQLGLALHHAAISLLALA